MSKPAHSTPRPLMRTPLPALAALALAALWVLPAAAAPDPLRRAEYYVNHQSIDPAYAASGVDSGVLIHVHEVVHPGNETRAAAEGKVILFVHGASTPGYVGFDAECAGCSIMAHLAMAGWDTFALDYEGYGRSTRQPTMDYPEAFPDVPAPSHSDVAVSNVERVVDFIRALRGVERVHLLGWSLGASRTAPLYAIRHPERVARMVLYAPGWDHLGQFEPNRAAWEQLEARKVMLSRPGMAGWARFGATPESVLPGAVETYQRMFLASDPRSGRNGGQVRFPAGRVADLLREKPQFDASRVTVPTLVIRGANDTFGSAADSQALVAALGSEEKAFVEIPGGSHNMQFERVHLEFFTAVQEFLEGRQ